MALVLFWYSAIAELRPLEGLGCRCRNTNNKILKILKILDALLIAVSCYSCLAVSGLTK